MILHGIGERLARGGTTIRGHTIPGTGDRRGAGLGVHHGTGDGDLRGAGEDIIPATGRPATTPRVLRGHIVLQATTVRSIVREEQLRPEGMATIVRATVPEHLRRLQVHIIPATITEPQQDRAIVPDVAAHRAAVPLPATLARDLIHLHNHHQAIVRDRQEVVPAADSEAIAADLAAAVAAEARVVVEAVADVTKNHFHRIN